MEDIIPIGEVGSLRFDDGVALLKIDSPPVNALGHAVRRALADGLQAALADKRAGAIVLCCGGRTFFAGADITELGKPILPPLLKDLIDLVEAAVKPVVVAMHGSALGGGFELALACHYRVAARSARVGLPEVALGLLPGAGGTQRLPRLLGVAAAVDMMVFARSLDSSEALAAGVIDAIVADETMEQDAIVFARGLLDREAPLRRVRDLAADMAAHEVQAWMERFRALHPGLFRGFKAPQAVLQAVEAAVSLPLEQGLAREAALSRELLAGPESAAQRHIFFAERGAAKVRDAASGAVARKVRSVAVAGTAERAAQLIAALSAQGISAGACEQTQADLVLDAGAGDGAMAPAGDSAGVLLNSCASGSLAELVRGENTSDETMLAALALARKLARAVIVTRPVAGGVTGQLVGAGKRAASVLASEGISPGAVSSALAAFGLPAAVAEMLAGAPCAAEQPRGDALARPVLETMAGHAAQLVEQGRVAHAADVDVASVHGIGWPAYTGGVLYWAKAQQGQTGEQAS